MNIPLRNRLVGLSICLRCLEDHFGSDMAIDPCKFAGCDCWCRSQKEAG